MIRTLLIDNYDSFTFNLHHYLAEVNGTPPVVVPNDWADWHPGVLDGFDNVVISPGPGSPDKFADFGICAEVIATATIPVLGICLGHQGIALAHGGTVAHAPSPRHGRLSEIRNFGVDLFTDLPPTFNAVRYHSLAVTDVPEALEVTAYSDDGVIMGLRHRTLPQWGVQFHPESISTEYSLQLLGNFARLTGEWADAKSGPDSEVHNDRRPGRTGERTEHSGPADKGLKGQAALHVEVLDHCAPAEQIFAALYGHEEESVWLDGNHPSSQSSRYSIMGAPIGPDGKIATADATNGRVRVRRTASTSAELVSAPAIVNSGFFDWMQNELASIEVESDVDCPPLPFDFRLGWVGYLGYELKAEVGSPNQHHSDLPDATMMFLDRAIVIDHVESRIYLLALKGLGASTADCEDWCEQTRNLICAINVETAVSPSEGASFGRSPLRAHHSHSEYLALIARSLEKITDGESYEICLTNMLESDGGFVTLNSRSDSLNAYFSLRADNPTPFGVYLTSKDVTILSTSPERFLRIGSDGTVESKPIKGTRARGNSEAEDEAIRNELRHCEKDRSENLMIVDLVRHDLGATAQLGSVAVEKLFDIETYSTVHQMVSTVSARLDPANSPVACVKAAFPPGSMTGAPKLRTMSIIEELEGGPRGVYSGTIGYFSLNGAVDLNVVIRTLVVADDTARYGVGGAIVALSDPEDEYAETVTKAAPLLRLLHDSEFPDESERTSAGIEISRGEALK
ncbi:aminodeoxychorismate synthase component I [Brevibacterium zhoupengii]|uniref:aminodeoxychorismate synthase component I n=1 Tax=Brevibacterium zhoupengii TaxID=2898795 RepID=UPI001E40264B|nr:aminodeoxychorismate synthase component I [Brevibacterium zhoupengii]